MNPSSGTEMVIYARASGLARLGACKQLCVPGGGWGGALGWAWGPKQAQVRAQLSPNSVPTEPGPLCLWDFGVVHTRFIFTTESLWHPNTALLSSMSLPQVRI